MHLHVQDVGVGLIAVLDELRIPQVVVLGDGAGAYIALRSYFCLHMGLEITAKIFVVQITKLTNHPNQCSGHKLYGAQKKNVLALGTVQRR